MSCAVARSNYGQGACNYGDHPSSLSDDYPLSDAVAGGLGSSIDRGIELSLARHN